MSNDNSYIYTVFGRVLDNQYNSITNIRTFCPLESNNYGQIAHL